MALSLYDVVIPAFQQTLSGVAETLEVGLKYCQEKGIDLDALVETRLCPDMLPFRFQIVSVAHHTQGALEGAKAGTFSPGGRQGPLSYTDLQALIAEARAALQALTPEAVNALEGTDVTFTMGERHIPFRAEGFLLSFSLPNLHFHATTAYDILRLQGAPVSKRHYLGPLRLKA